MSDDDDFIVGLCGKISPRSPSFKQDLAVLAKHPRFVGIRCGAGELLDSPSCAEQLRALRDHDLQLGKSTTILQLRVRCRSSLTDCL